MDLFTKKMESELRIHNFTVVRVDLGTWVWKKRERNPSEGGAAGNKTFRNGNNISTVWMAVNLRWCRSCLE